MRDEDAFASLLIANEAYAGGLGNERLPGMAAEGLAILTCIDSRIDPLAMLGLRAGDAKILRNAGARVTDDVLRTLVLTTYLLGVDRVMIIGHTDCAMTAASEQAIHQAIREAGGPDTTSLGFLTTSDLESSLRADVRRVRSWPFLPAIRVGGFIYDVDTGRLRPISDVSA